MAEEMLSVTGYPVTTTSKKALESFNEGVKAYVTLNGNCMLHLTKALEVDSDFLLVHCILGMFRLDSLKTPSDPEVSHHIKVVEKAQKENKFNEREEAYIQALQSFASGDLLKATDELISILMKYPLDILALRFVAGNTITVGSYERARDTVAWVLPFWDESMEFYPNVLAFYSFALEETNERAKAEQLALRSLEMKPATPWAHHTMTHVLEETHDAKDGVEFLSKTRSDWKDSSFGNHLNWHLTLHYFDIGDIDSVFHEYDSNMSQNVITENLFGLLDASSLLWRLEVSGVNVGEERWSKVYKAISEHAHNHRSPWFDTHIMMGLAYGRVTQDTARLTIAQAMIKSMKDYSQAKNAFNGSMSEKLGVPVCSALLAYGQEKYDDVLQTLLPLRFDFIRFGGSWAQRQVFIVTLIEASIKAKKPSITKGLLGELKGQKPKSQKIERWLNELNS